MEFLASWDFLSFPQPLQANDEKVDDLEIGYDCILSNPYLLAVIIRPSH
jgi:hypothetical protein